MIWTNLPRQLTNEDMTNMGFIDEKGEPNAAKYPRKSLAQGAATQVVAAFDPSIASKVVHLSSLAGDRFSSPQIGRAHV